MKSIDRSKLMRLRQIHIEKPCPEEWEGMEGDEKQRFCAGCGCSVHNIAAMDAAEAEDLLAKPGGVCVRTTVDSERGVLTRDGWIPRLLLAGALAATTAGCTATTMMGDAAATEPPLTGKVAVIAPIKKVVPKATPAPAKKNKVRVKSTAQVDHQFMGFISCQSTSIATGKPAVVKPLKK